MSPPASGPLLDALCFARIRTAIRRCGFVGQRRDKTITLHVLRHTAAMRLLHAGVDTALTALWLGPEQVETTQLVVPRNDLDPFRGDAQASEHVRQKWPDARGPFGPPKAITSTASNGRPVTRRPQTAGESRPLDTEKSFGALGQ